MTTIWYRQGEDEEYRPITPWQGISKERAHSIADEYNTKYGHGMWWVSQEKPSKDKVVEGWRECTTTYT